MFFRRTVSKLCGAAYNATHANSATLGRKKPPDLENVNRNIVGAGAIIAGVTLLGMFCGSNRDELEQDPLLCSTKLLNKVQK